MNVYLEDKGWISYGIVILWKRGIFLLYIVYVYEIKFYVYKINKFYVYKRNNDNVLYIFVNIVNVFIYDYLVKMEKRVYIGYLRWWGLYRRIACVSVILFI